MDTINFSKLAQGMNLYHDTDLYLMRGFHTHELYEIVIPVKGEFLYLVEKNLYQLRTGDLLVVNNTEIHKPAPIKSIDGTERILVHFTIPAINLLNSPQMCLTDCFMKRPLGERNKISLSKNQWNELMKILSRIELSQIDSSIGHELMKTTGMLELLVYVNRLYLDCVESESVHGIPEKLKPIIDYIEQNLVEELSLEKLEGLFYINRFYLSRLFKEKMGVSIHKYIMLRRVSLAKRLLGEGISVTKACHQSGFNDYANFIRCFKTVTGIPPGKYGKLQELT